MIDKNSEWLMIWCEKMIGKYGHPHEGVDWCRKLAYHMGEEGNESPSDDAIAEAKRWLESNPEREATDA